MGSSSSSSSSVSGTSQTSRNPSSSLSNVALPGVSQPSTASTASDIFGVSVASTSLPNSNDSLTDKKSTPAIVGGVVGGCVLLGALAIFLLLLYRKKIQRLKHRHLSWQHKDEDTGFERMGGGELIRTPYLERPLPSPARHIDESKSPSSPDTLNSRANPDSIVSSITSASSPVTPSNRSGRSNSQNNDLRRNPSHGHERHQSTSNYASTLHPEVPPPAYSDVNENTDDHGHGNERRRR
ncbi:hypothetical protein FRC20_002231 [Serendipita sp. 405]|nr:hypothetical protein FRC20_002231 [Serendipita sp. 405]